MPIEQTSADCPHCGDLILATRPGTNHLLHGVATLATVGLWVPVWIVAAGRDNPYRCTRCGSTATPAPGEEPAPGGLATRLSPGAAAALILALLAVVFIGVPLLLGR